jgi:hypothetical protein
MKKTVDKIPFYRLGWNKGIYFFYYLNKVYTIEILKPDTISND